MRKSFAAFSVDTVSIPDTNPNNLTKALKALYKKILKAMPWSIFINAVGFLQIEIMHRAVFGDKSGTLPFNVASDLTIVIYVVSTY